LENIQSTRRRRVELFSPIPLPNGENGSKVANQESSSPSPGDKDDHEARQDGAPREIVTRTPAGAPLPTDDEWEEL